MICRNSHKQCTASHSRLWLLLATGAGAAAKHAAAAMVRSGRCLQLRLQPHLHLQGVASISSLPILFVLHAMGLRAHLRCPMGLQIPSSTSIVLANVTPVGC